MRPTLYVLLGVLLVPTVGLVGDIVTDGKFKSTVEREPPLEVASEEMVVNLNSDYVDGLDASDFALTSDTYNKTEVDALIAAVTDACAPKGYYVTRFTYAANEVYSACAIGFHFASLHEIRDTSNLRYLQNSLIAEVNDDSGKGPPMLVNAWVRTGYNSSGANSPAAANCNTWTSTIDSDFGTRLHLNPIPFDERGIAWSVGTRRCDADDMRVWCVED